MNFKEMGRFDLLPEFRNWGALAGDFQFVITLDESINEYRCSWKHRSHIDQMAIHLDEVFQTFAAAEEACKKTWKQLRMKN